ncbi:probable acyl-activating enzyme 2 isoform X2 [Asparagus officinalis]|uniref:probable acyl-activating enzyme 2 isoform X2 n=1 Tax=Asparagus officinalis TaxID=4686 RepID=UPI00098E6484|nr:probable acyl-activating enzyme 2 isoform X2 [Asparagus officinalis]
MEGTVRCSANYVPLSPLSFIERSAEVYSDRTSVVYESIEFTWRQTRDRCLRLASALSHLGVSRGDVVAVLAPNVPAMYELNFGVPMAGAVICTLNAHHDAAMVSVLLKHSEAKLIFVDHQFLTIAEDAINLLSQSNSKSPLLIPIPEPSEDYSHSPGLNYESLIKNGDPCFDIKWPIDECDPIALNYTSGTTSRPKGVVYTHRGAYLNCISSILFSEIRTLPVYLWTVPIFHSNGWCLTWGIAAQGGLNVCLRDFTAKTIFEKITRYGVTHMTGAPTILNMMANCPPADRQPLAAEGIRHIGTEAVDVKDPETMKSVPADGKTMGEVMFRGNTVMNGYFKDLKATEEVFAGGWMRTGDLGVRHADGYIQVKDRLKDIIISGLENISTIEVESVVYSHESAVVGRPDEYWGETPCAFVKLKDGASADAEEIIGFCRARLPDFMVPKSVVFGELPKTSTGKMQKFVLRERAKAMGSLFMNGGGKMLEI